MKIKNRIIFLLVALTPLALSTNVFAQTGFQPEIITSFSPDPGTYHHTMVCGANDEIHILAANSFANMAILSKKVGATSWTTKFPGASFDIIRARPVIHITPAGYGCAMWQDTNNTYISFKTPTTDWSSKTDLDNSLSFSFNNGLEGFDCSANDINEVLAVWRSPNEVKYAFKNSSGQITKGNVIQNLNTSTDQPKDFRVALTNGSIGRLFFIERDKSAAQSGDIARSFTRTSNGSWGDSGNFITRRKGGLFIKDMDFDATNNRGIITVVYTILGGDDDSIPGAGIYSSDFSILSSPALSLIASNESSSDSTLAFLVSGAPTTAGNDYAIPLININNGTKVAKVLTKRGEFVIDSLPTIDLPRVSTGFSDVDGSISGQAGIFGINNFRKITEQDFPPFDIISTEYKVKATVRRNEINEVLDLVNDTVNGSLNGTLYVGTAACASGNGTFSFVNKNQKLVTVDFIANPGGSGMQPTPTATPQNTLPTSNSNDACPDDINKTEAGVCGCGVSESDINNDSLIDCGSPRVFIKNIIPSIISAVPNGKGKLIVQIEGLEGDKLNYTLSIKGPKGFSKEYKANKLLLNISKLPAGQLTLKLKVVQKVGKKTTNSKSSAGLKVIGL